MKDNKFVVTEEDDSFDKAMDKMTLYENIKLFRKKFVELYNEIAEKKIWKKQIPNKEGLWIRQCSAKGHNELHLVTKRIQYKYGRQTSVLTMDWGWTGEQKMIDVNDLKYKRKLESFYWIGAFDLPPNSNLLAVVNE